MPNNFANTTANSSFLGPLANSERTYQLLIHEDLLTSLQNKELTSINFRIPTSSSAAWPTSTTTFTNYDIYLSESVAPAQRSLTFAENIVGAQTQVRAGSLVIPPNA